MCLQVTRDNACENHQPRAMSPEMRAVGGGSGGGGDGGGNGTNDERYNDRRRTNRSLDQYGCAGRLRRTHTTRRRRASRVAAAQVVSHTPPPSAALVLSPHHCASTHGMKISNVQITPRVTCARSSIQHPARDVPLLKDAIGRTRYDFVVVLSLACFDITRTNFIAYFTFYYIKFRIS